MSETHNPQKESIMDYIPMLEACNSEDEWNAVCDKVKAERGGQYPDDWYENVVLSGLARRVAARFGRTDEIEIVRG